jgi:lysophospholipase L1-like esterase
MWLLLAAALVCQTAPPLTLEDELAAHIRLLADWGSLVRYGSENAELPSPKPGENRVVFFGDDVIEAWDFEKSFPGKPYLNRGIARQTTPQMLVRFRQDVLSLKPKVVLIMGGSNDIAGYSGPGTTGTVAENVMSMVELAKLHGIGVVLASVTPVCDCAGRQLTERRPHGKLLGINEWLEEYAKTSGSAYVNLYAPLVKARALPREFARDGLVLSDRGYAVIAPLVEAAIAKALPAPKP